MSTHPGPLHLAAALWLGAAGAASAQILPDDAGGTADTAGILHVGVNEGRFDYKLPRALDVDVWSFTTQPGKIYWVRCVPVDDLTESVNALPFTTYLFNFAEGVRHLGFDNSTVWTRGTGGVITRTVSGLARSDGTPVRYTVEVIEAPDPGDPEGDDAAHATLLQPGVWFDGAIAAPAANPAPQGLYPNALVNDTDAFTFNFDDRGVYRVELDSLPTNNLVSVSTAGIVLRTSSYTASSTLTSYAVLLNGIEFRGSGTALFSLSSYQQESQSVPYRVRVVRTGTAPADDHGDTPDGATPLTPGAAPTRVNLSSPVAIPGSTARISDPDWFSVQTVAGHSYEARVERAGTGYSGTTVSDVLAEDGGHHADAALNFHQGPPATNLLASVRFRGRAGTPVKFGLLGAGTATITLIDQGPVTDDFGDPLTGAAALSMTHPTISGRLENPRDIDSFTIEPPDTTGVYRVDYHVVGYTGADGFAPGCVLTTGATRGNPAFHISNGSVTLTRRTDGQADSFPARLDLLNKPWPTTVYPLIGPTISYTLSLSYVGPITDPPGPTIPPDDAPSTAEGATLLAVGQILNLQRQGAADDADAVVLDLQPGRLYRMAGRAYGGEIFSAGGALIPTELFNNDGFGRQFTVPVAGLYTQRQVYGVPIPESYAFTTSFQAGVTDAGPAGTEAPGERTVRALPLGVTTGTFDYPLDRDNFILPYDAGGVYRVTVTSPAPFFLATDYPDYVYPEAPGPYVFTVYFADSSLPPPGKTFTIASPTPGQPGYQILVEKVAQLHPADDLPEVPGLRPPLSPGESAILVKDRAADTDVLEFRVQAGHLYTVRSAALESPDVPTNNLYGTVYDTQERAVHSQRLGAPMRADADEVWHVVFSNIWDTPIRATIVDEGPGDDDYGTGERTAAHLHVQQTGTGSLERADDADLWLFDGNTATQTRLTLTDLDRGLTRITEYSGLPLTSVQVDADAMPAGSTFPARYSLVLEPIIITPPRAPCRPDLGRAGGQASTTGDHILDNNDIVAFITYFFANSPRADFASAGAVPTPDGWLDNNDFIVFIDLFFQGCP